MLVLVDLYQLEIGPRIISAKFRIRYGWRIDLDIIALMIITAFAKETVVYDFVDV